MMWLIHDAITTNRGDYIYMNAPDYRTFIASCICHNSLLTEVLLQIQVCMSKVDANSCSSQLWCFIDIMSEKTLAALIQQNSSSKLSILRDLVWSKLIKSMSTLFLNAVLGRSCITQNVWDLYHQAQRWKI